MPCLTSVNVQRPTRFRREAASQLKSVRPLSGTGLFHPLPGAIARRRAVSQCSIATLQTTRPLSFRTSMNL